MAVNLVRFLSISRCLASVVNLVRFSILRGSSRSTERPYVPRSAGNETSWALNSPVVVMAFSRAQETFAHGVTLKDFAEEPLHWTLWRRPTRYWLNLSASLSTPSNSAAYRVRASCLTTQPCAQIRCKTTSITRASLTLPIRLRWMLFVLIFFLPQGVGKPSFWRALPRFGSIAHCAPRSNKCLYINLVILVDFSFFS